MTIIDNNSTPEVAWDKWSNGTKDPAAQAPVVKRKTKPQTDLSGFDEKALSFLRANPGWQTTQTILAETYPTAHSTSVSKKLKDLAGAGKVRNKLMKNTHHWRVTEHKTAQGEDAVKTLAEPAKPLFTISYFPDHAELSLSDAAKIVDALRAQ